MAKVKQILCIYPEPVELRIHALLNRQGMAVDLTEVSLAETVRSALERVAWWDLILCDARACDDLGIPSALTRVRDRLDASLVLLKSPESRLSPAEGSRRGAADVVVRGDLDHLLMVCEREFKNCALRKQLRNLLYSSTVSSPDASGAVLLPTITDLSKTLGARKHEYAVGMSGADADAAKPLEPARIRALIDAGGLVLEYQPIVSFRADVEHRNMFETLVRLTDERGRLLLPEAFLPVVAAAGWMGKIDLWIFRQALTVLEEMQSASIGDVVLFVNLATETLQDDHLVRAIGTFVSAAHIAPGSVVVEVRKNAFSAAPDALSRLGSMLRSNMHGLLVEGMGFDDDDLLAAHQGFVTHVKLDRSVLQGLADGPASQAALAGFVRRAHQDDVRVIALAVEDATLLPRLFAVGVDAIQGNLMSMPYHELVYPGVQHIGPTASAH